jgi:hypothetical protein
MIAMLDIYGWQKKMDIPLECFYSGFVLIHLEKPLSCIIPATAIEAEKATITSVKLFYVGNAIFKIEP